MRLSIPTFYCNNFSSLLAKMMICLWKGCDFSSEELAAFQEHVITKHVEEQKQLNLDQQNDVDTKEEGMTAEDGQMAKLSLDEDKMITKEGNSKIIFLAIEVWVDVLGFIRRIQLANTVSLTNRRFHQICWPRMHGDKVVVAHEMSYIIIGHRHALIQPPTALFLKDHKEVPFPECPAPDYVTGLNSIHIKFLDNQVLAFMSLIVPRITMNNVIIQFTKKFSDLDENQIASVNQLLQIFGEKITMPSIHFWRCLSNIQFLPGVDDKMKTIECWHIEESDIRIIMAFLASPRPDGQQRVMIMKLLVVEQCQKLLDAIKEEFRSSIQPLPQPFCLQIRTNLNIPHEEQNPQTDETLIITFHDGCCLDIFRHPRGQHEQWAEDARKRLDELFRDNFMTEIYLDIAEFGNFSIYNHKSIINITYALRNEQQQ